MMPAGPVTLTPLAGIPIVREGDDVASLVGNAIDAAGIVPAGFDVVVVTQKIVSKAEGRRVRLTDVEPSPRAAELAASLGKDPRMVEVVLGESNEIVAHGHGVLVAEHRSGHVMANAGVDRSNVGRSSVGDPGNDTGVGDKAVAEEALADETVLLLPSDPDASAAALHRALEARFGCRLAVVVSDSVGRAWRHGGGGYRGRCGGTALARRSAWRPGPLRRVAEGDADRLRRPDRLGREPRRRGGRRGRAGRTRAGARVERRADAGPSARART